MSSDGFDESDRSQPAYRKVLKDSREAVSDRGRGVRSRGERAAHEGTRTTGDDLQMQYLVSVIDDTAGLATPDEMAAINAFNLTFRTSES